MRALRGLLLLVLVPTLLGTACVRLHGPNDIKRELSRSAGVELNKEFGITVTRSGVWLARKVLKWTGEADEVPSLKGIKRVQVGIYEVKGLRPGVEAYRGIDDSVFPQDWSPMVRISDHGEDVAVMVKYDKKEPERMRQMLIVVAEEDEWVLVRIKGNLNRVIEEALQMAFDEVDRPELYQRTREERGLDPKPAPIAEGNPHCYGIV